MCRSERIRGDRRPDQYNLAMHTMTKRLARMIRLFALAAALAAIGASGALASVHLTYNVLKDFPGGNCASWLHSADVGGSTANGAYFTGDDMSGRLAGVLEGDLSGNILSNITGVVSGKLKQLSNYLPDADIYLMSQAFDLKLGVAAGGSGALQFISNSGGEFAGGWVDFSLVVGDDELMGGTLFFKPQAETASASLSPNRGDSSEFTLWGLNWTHDSPAVVGETPDFAAFLAGLGHPSTANRPDVEGATLGIALYVTDPDPPLTYAANPEPTTFLVWGVLAMIGAGYCRRER